MYDARVILGLWIATLPPGSPPVSRESAPEPERILARAYVPSPERRVGEVRLIERGESVVVQTILYTRVLKRVVGEIRAKEEANWPADRPGHADMRRYVEALEAARDAIGKSVARLDRRADREQRLLIEFVAGPRCAVTLGIPEVARENGEIRVVSLQPLASLDLSAEYVRRNMLLILDDSLHLSGEDVRRLAPSLIEGK